MQSSVMIRDMENGEGAYRRLNEQAMRLLSKDGILVSASCSMHLPEDDLRNSIKNVVGCARTVGANAAQLRAFVFRCPG
jgi:23S rRNA G2069 N7-methylase RlmK/C1962 C5-methylase RlmI